MAQDVAQLATQLEKMNARLEQALKARRGGGPFRAVKPLFYGALLGAGAALLYAPQTGERTRALLLRSAGELRERATQGTQTAKETLQSTTAAAQDTAQQRLAQVADKVNATVQDGRAKTNEIIKGAKGTIQQGGAQAQQAVDAGGEQEQAAAGKGGTTVQATADTAVDKAAQGPRARATSPPQAS